MKKKFIVPTIEIIAFESNDILTTSGLVVTEGSSTTEQTKSFSEVSNIFNGIL